MIRVLTWILAVTSCFASASEWPEFRGPTGQGISAATDVPVSWDAKRNVVWKVAAPEGWSSPVISAGRIYLTGAESVGGGVSLRVLCFDLKDGKSTWNVEAIHAEDGGARTRHRKNSLASPTPIVRDGKLFAHFGHMGTAALDLSGKVLWRQTSIKYPSVHGNGGSPALAGKVLIFTCDGASDPFVAGLDATTGEIKWKTPRNTPAKSQFSFSTPLVIAADGTEQAIIPGSGFVGSYEPATGKERWRAEYGEGYSVVPRPVFAHGLIFVSSGFDTAVIHALTPTGEKKWSERRGAPNTPSLLVAGNELYAVSDAGIASCYDAKTGQLHWNERLGKGFSASPVFAEGRIYFQNEEGVGYVVEAKKEFKVLSENDLKDRTLASPAIIDDAIVIRSAAWLWKLGR